MQTWSKPGDNISKLRKQSTEYTELSIEEFDCNVQTTSKWPQCTSLCVFLFYFLFLSFVTWKCRKLIGNFTLVLGRSSFFSYPSQVSLPDLLNTRRCKCTLLQYNCHQVFVLWTSIISTSTRHENMPPIVLFKIILCSTILTNMWNK